MDEQYGFRGAYPDEPGLLGSVGRVRKRVTITDVAAALQVSTATVSRALNGDPAISPATTRAVLEMTRRVGYRPSAAARRLRTKSSSL